jgi:uncharacterized protein (DUF362 family)
MSGCCGGSTRREFLGSTVAGLAGVYAGLSLPRLVWGAARQSPDSCAALTAGASRGDNVLNALKLIEPQIVKSLASKKRVVLKPNMVVINRQLAASHVNCLEAVCEFLSPLYKGEIIIADSPASGVVTEGYENYGYLRLQKKYRIKFVDLDEAETSLRYVSDHRLQPQPVRMVNLLLDPDTYIISAAMPKTHDRAVVTLSLKNIVVGAAKKDHGFRWGPGSKGKNDKIAIHGGPGDEAIHLNLFQLAQQLRPDLAVIDGYEGMEHNGPVGGTPVDHKIAIASTDWLAADRMAVDLMGFEFDKIGYLKFCANQGMGQSDLSRVEIRGEKPANHARTYKPHDSIERQYQWMTRQAKVEA